VRLREVVENQLGEFAVESGVDDQFIRGALATATEGGDELVWTVDSPV
jgi:hypothetical protein